MNLIVRPCILQLYHEASTEAIKSQGEKTHLSSGAFTVSCLYEGIHGNHSGITSIFATLFIP